MPRSPILSREAFYTRLPNNGGLNDLDFCLVNTSLGAMIEPVSMSKIDPKMASVDVYDAAFTKLTEMSADEVYRLTNQSGFGVFQSFAR